MNKNNNRNQQILRQGENLISRITTLLDSKFPIFKNKKSQAIQTNQKIWPIQRKIDVSTDTVPKKQLMTDTLEKDFKHLS